MTTKVITRDKVSEWSKTFPTEIASQKKASIFMKKLFAVAISNCLYIRNIFPDHAFFNKNLSGLNLKILKEDSNCSGATKVISWMRGCFDAFEKQFLKAVIIGLYTNPEDPDTVVESYTFEFKYFEDDVELNVTKESDSESLNTSLSNKTVPMDDIKSATISLLRILFETGNTLSEVPDNLLLSMKLLYYDEITPEDYEPPGFKASSLAEYRFKKKFADQYVGSVETHLHSLKMNMQFESEKEFPNKKKLSTKETSVCDPSPVYAESVFSAANTPGSGRAINVNTPDSNARSFVANDDEFPVNCPCFVKKDYGTMVLCEVCKNWLHSVCIGIVDDNNVPESLICDCCADLNPELSGTYRIDTILQAMSKEERQMWCLIRRSLFIIPALKNLQASILAKELDVEIGVCQMIWSKLENEGAFLKVKGKRQTKAVNRKKIIDVLLPKYFGPDANKENNIEKMDVQDVANDQVSSFVTPWGDTNSAITEIEENAAHLSIENNINVESKRKRKSKAENDDSSPGTSKKRKRSHVVNTPIHIKKNKNK